MERILKVNKNIIMHKNGEAVVRISLGEVFEHYQRGRTKLNNGYSAQFYMAKHLNEWISLFESEITFNGDLV